MKRLLLILILTFSFQTPSLADDIRDFEIEGISVGDSLLEFFDELDLTVQIIKDYPKNIYPGSKKFHGLRINKKLGEYDHFSVMLKKNDEKYIIHSLRGKKVFDNNIEGCKKYKKKVVDNLKDLLTNVKQSPAQASNNTRGLCQGGTAPAQLDIIDYVTIASAGNATDFGDSTLGRSNCAGAASSVRAVQAGGGSPGVSNVIDYVTIASTGDASDFGDLTQAGKAPAPSSDSTRAVFAGRHTPSKQTTMDFITIATTGNASDFGDLKAAASEKGGLSDSHAGLQG